MSTVERKEYKETKILRTLSPVRNTHGSSQNLSEFDSNLDYLLEDLQNSVSRPGSSLGQNTNNFRETSRTINTLDSNRSNSLNRITASKGPLTEYSSDDAYNYSSPDGRQHISGYKKEKYMYKTSSSGDVFPEKSRMQSSINQLDTLLDDLQQVKKSSYSDRESYNVSGLDPSFQGSSTTKSVNRELNYGDTTRSSSRSRTLERTDGSLSRREYINEGTYGDIRSLRPTSPSPSSKTSTLTKQAKVTNIHEYPVEVRETVVPDIDPEVLAHLDPNLRPPGNTKVTTTIKTYTYEIPGSGDYPTNLSANTTVDSEKYIYSPNQSQNQTITTPSKSFVYNKIENKENTFYEDNTSYPLYKKPTPPGGGGVLVKETITTRNYQPGYSPELNPPSNHQTYLYNETTSTKNVANGYPPQPQESYVPPGKETYIIKETKTVDKTNTTPYSERGYPVYNPPEARNITYINKETHNRTFQNGYPPNEPPGKTVIYKHETHTTTNNSYGPGDEPKPKEPINIRYTYKSTNTSQNSYKGGFPPETETLLPQKFPVNESVDGPPKRLDELMATIGNEPPNSPLNAGFSAHEQELAQQKKVDTLKRQAEEADDMQKKEPLVKTKNVSGPPVYYPPGHEMFAKKEESEAAWRAQGGYAKASGKYMYEAESKSKSKSSGGAAVVPICLPLCCGLPCTLL